MNSILVSFKLLHLITFLQNNFYLAYKISATVFQLWCVFNLYANAFQSTLISNQTWLKMKFLMMELTVNCDLYFPKAMEDGQFWEQILCSAVMSLFAAPH